MITPDQIEGSNVILRLDLDLPVKGGRVENSYRLEAVLPTIKLCLQHARRTCVIGHRGRPQAADPGLSLAPVKLEIERLINQPISLISSGFSPGECWTGESPISMIENLRFSPGEENKDVEFAMNLSQGADIYVYESFATYRSCTSLTLLPEYLPTLTGARFDLEVKMLSGLINSPKHPTLLIASGAKPDKLELIKKISPLFDQVLYGGKFASPEHLTPDGLDINSNAQKAFAEAISKANTVVLNGPLGRFEDTQNSIGTKNVLESLKNSSAEVIIGGGDTLSAILDLGFSYSDFGFVSTGGGAMLSFLETGSHPLTKILKNARL